MAFIMGTNTSSTSSSNSAIPHQNRNSRLSLPVVIQNNSKEQQWHPLSSRALLLTPSIFSSSSFYSSFSDSFLHDFRSDGGGDIPSSPLPTSSSSSISSFSSSHSHSTPTHPNVVSTTTLLPFSSSPSSLYTSSDHSPMMAMMRKRSPTSSVVVECSSRTSDRTTDASTGGSDRGSDGGREGGRTSGGGDDIGSDNSSISSSEGDLFFHSMVPSEYSDSTTSTETQRSSFSSQISEAATPSPLNRTNSSSFGGNSLSSVESSPHSTFSFWDSTSSSSLLSSSFATILSSSISSTSSSTSSSSLSSTSSSSLSSTSSSSLSYSSSTRSRGVSPHEVCLEMAKTSCGSGGVAPFESEDLLLSSSLSACLPSISALCSTSNSSRSSNNISVGLLPKANTNNYMITTKVTEHGSNRTCESSSLISRYRYLQYSNSIRPSNTTRIASSSFQQPQLNMGFALRACGSEGLLPLPVPSSSSIFPSSTSFFQSSRKKAIENEESSSSSTKISRAPLCGMSSVSSSSSFSLAVSSPSILLSRSSNFCERPSSSPHVETSFSASSDPSSSSSASSSFSPSVVSSRSPLSHSSLLYSSSSCSALPSCPTSPANRFDGFLKEEKFSNSTEDTSFPSSYFPSSYSLLVDSPPSTQACIDWPSLCSASSLSVRSKRFSSFCSSPAEATKLKGSAFSSSSSSSSPPSSGTSGSSIWQTARIEGRMRRHSLHSCPVRQSGNSNSNDNSNSSSETSTPFLPSSTSKVVGNSSLFTHQRNTKPLINLMTTRVMTTASWGTAFEKSEMEKNSRNGGNSKNTDKRRSTSSRINYKRNNSSSGSDNNSTDILKFSSSALAMTTMEDNPRCSASSIPLMPPGFSSSSPLCSSFSPSSSSSSTSLLVDDSSSLSFFSSSFSSFPCCSFPASSGYTCDCASPNNSRRPSHVTQHLLLMLRDVGVASARIVEEGEYEEEERQRQQYLEGSDCVKTIMSTNVIDAQTLTTMGSTSTSTSTSISSGENSVKAAAVMREAVDEGDEVKGEERRGLSSDTAKEDEGEENGECKSTREKEGGRKKGSKKKGKTMVTTNGKKTAMTTTSSRRTLQQENGETVEEDWEAGEDEEEIVAVKLQSAKLEPSIVWDGDQLLVLEKPPWWHCSDCRVSPSRDGRTPQEVVRSRKSEPLGLYVSLQFQYPTSQSWRCNHGLGHRLDVETSGPMIICKTEFAWEAIRRQMNKRSVVKEYVFLCHGHMQERFKVIAAPIVTENDGRRLSSCIHPSGQPSLTVVKPLALFRLKKDYTKTFSLVWCQIYTGRTHQIRVHMQSLKDLNGMPHCLVSDSKYGEGRHHFDLGWCKRMFLHQHRLQFRDLTGKAQCIISPLPLDLLDALRHVDEVSVMEPTWKRMSEWLRSSSSIPSNPSLGGRPPQIELIVSLSYHEQLCYERACSGIFCFSNRYRIHKKLSKNVNNHRRVHKLVWTAIGGLERDWRRSSG